LHIRVAHLQKYIAAAMKTGPENARLSILHLPRLGLCSAVVLLGGGGMPKALFRWENSSSAASIQSGRVERNRRDAMNAEKRARERVPKPITFQ
jgi:transposase